ncbi:ankyrin repeat domain-containing protein [Endozoicomonas acroporae]|uniref:ankyrin repeat domain-containing protein n=1 Tax=Endozoicomonas acroporae TaxID=1701104 RepID=UPI0019D5A096|nr:ankyrin repeat domain-containing protein [Endozoicomonas acroporae]
MLKVDVNVKTHTDGATPLHMAAQNGHIESVKELLENYQTPVNKQMNDGCTPLHLAARNGHTEIVRAFKDIAPMRIQVDVKNNNGDTALHEAARQGHTETVNALVEIDRSPLLAKAKNNDDETAIHAAALNGHTDAIQTLLNFDRSLAKEKTNDAQTALHAAALNGHTEAIQTLLNFDRSLAKEKDRYGLTALHYGARKDQTEAIQALLDFDRSLAKEKDNNGQTALHYAVYSGQTVAIQALLNFDRSLAKKKDNNGRTALHAAALKGHTEAIRTLLAFDPSLAKKKSNFGHTALHKAAAKGHKEAIRALLDFDPSMAKDLAKVKDKNCETAPNLAKGFKETTKLFTYFAISQANHEKDNSTLTTNVKIDDSKKADKTAQAGSVATNDPAPTDSKTAVDSRKRSFNEGPDTDPAPRELSTIESPAISENRTALADSAVEEDSIVSPQEYPPSGEAKDVDELGKTKLHRAAEKGDFSELHSLSFKENINQIDNSGKTALHYAAEKGHIQYLPYLFSKENINQTDKSGKTPLHYPILYKHEEFLEELCKKYVKHFSFENISHALRLAIDENYDNKGTELLVNRVRLEDQGETDDKTLLHYAAEKGNKNYLEKFLEKAIREGNLESIKLKDKRKRTPLHYAAEEGHRDCLRLLLLKEPKLEEELKLKKELKELTWINDKDENGDTPLLLADTDACVRELIEAKADVHKTNNKGITLLHRIAMSEMRINWLKENYKCSKDINEPDMDDNTPLHYAAYNGNIRFLQVICEKEGKTIHKYFHINNKKGVSPLLLTIHNDNKNEGLIKLIKTINIIQDRYQLSRLFLYAAAYGKNYFLERFFDENFNKTIDINHTVQHSGMAPLHYVIIKKCWNHNSSKEVQGYEKCLERILSKFDDVDINLPDNQGMTPLHLAAEADDIYCLKMLLDPEKRKVKIKVEINATDDQGKTPLHLAAEADNIRCLKRLLEEKKDTLIINAIDDQGKTPLHLAAEADNIKCLIGLLDQIKHPVNINAKDDQNNKPLDLAKHPVCQEALLEDWNNLNECERKNKGEYYLNKYFEGQTCQTNDQNENTHSQSNPVDLSDGSIRYQEKVFINNQVVDRLGEIKVKYPELNFIPCPEVDSFFVLAKNFVGKIIKGSHEDAIFGYSGIRGNLNTKNPEDWKQIYVPVHFIPGFKPNNNLILDGYPFHIEGTKDKIIEFLDKYEGLHFTAKSIDKKEQSKARVSVNIKLCVLDCDLPENLPKKKMVRKLFVAAIQDASGVPIPLDFIEEIIEHVDLQSLLKKIPDAVNIIKKILQEEAVNTAEEMQENLGSETAEQLKKTASKKIKSVINKIRNELKRLNETYDIDTLLSKNNFKVCSGPINLLHNIKKGQKIHIEFDRFESSNSPARLQIKSTRSQVEFKDLSEALKMIFEI